MDHIKLISIEGNIGSGKSTLMKALREKYIETKNVIFLDEPVEEWNKIKDEHGKTMLEKFYEEQEKYSFPFQMMAYISRLKLIKDKYESIKQNNSRNDTFYIITERSLYTDKLVFAKMLHASNKIEDITYQIYLLWFETFANDYPVNSLIYIQTSPNICKERIFKRQREGEENINQEYLKLCNDYHEHMIITMKDLGIKDVLYLDGNDDIYEKNNILQSWLLLIDKFLYK
jgi:deoxyadenosine/deoxycytidine kinase